MSLLILISLLLTYHEYLFFLAILGLTGAYVACALVYCHLAGHTHRSHSKRHTTGPRGCESDWPADASECV